MNKGYKSSNIINTIILKIKEKKEYNSKEYFKEIKNNSNEVEMANIIRKYLKEDKNKFSIEDTENKKNMNQNKKDFSSKINFKDISKKQNLYKMEHNFLNLIKIFITLSSLICRFKQENFLFKLSEVILKINGIKNASILSDTFFRSYIPCQIYINDSLEDNIANRYDFKESEINTIKIKWNNTIETTSYMFNNCNKIIEIDLSYFNSPNIINMTGMFSKCESLTSVNLSNFNTSNVIDMNKMFIYYLSLISLDLSNFNISNVNNMNRMFSNCSKLNE